MRAVKRKRGQGESYLKDEPVEKTNLLQFGALSKVQSDLPKVALDVCLTLGTLTQDPL